MTNEPGFDLKIPPQFIDSNLLNLANCPVLPTPKSSPRLLHTPHDLVRTVELDILEKLHECHKLSPSSSMAPIKIQLHSMLMHMYSPENILPKMARNLPKGERERRATLAIKDIFNGMKTHQMMRYFIYDVFDLLYLHRSDLPSEFTEEYLLKETPNFTLHRFTKSIQYLLSSKIQPLLIDFGELYYLYAAINDRAKYRVVEIGRVLKEILSKYNNIEIWTDEVGNTILCSSKLGFDERPHEALTKRVIYRNGLSHLRNSQKSFFNLYRRYIRGMSSILSFTNCAGNRTRTAKLFAPELKFYFEKSMGEISKRRGNFYNKFRINNAQIELKKARLRRLVTSPTENYNQESRGIPKSTIIKNLKIELEQLYTEKSSLEYAKKHEGFMKSLKSEGFMKSFKSEYIDSLSTTNENNEVDFSNVIDFHIESGMSVIPMVISGDAGMGKTTVMAQCSLSYFSRLEDKLDHFLSVDEGMPSLPLPVVLKAKRFPSPSLPKFVVDSNPELLKHISFEEIMQLFETWSSMKDLHNSSMVFFVDGVDECATKNDAKAMFEMVKSSSHSSNDKSVLIISTRPSHEDVVFESLPRTSICRMRKGIGEFYSENELSQKMPIMLCDAWGLTRESGEKLSEIFETYQDTLVHPLFVGWFCFLILEGKLEEIEDSSNVVEISQNNLIKTIIEIGVEKSLARRESYIGDTIKNNQTTAEEFRELLEMFVSVAFHYNISKPSKVFTKMRQLGFVKSVSEEIKNSIKNDCGILFLTGNNIEWTHTTIPEIIYADFYFKNDLSINLGPIRVSEPVISRMAQLHYENGDFESYASAELNLKHKLLPIQDFVEFLEYEMFDLHKDTLQVRVEPILCVTDSKLSPVTNRKMLDIEVQVAKLYIDSLGTRKQFALSKDYIVAEDLNDAIPLIYEQSNNPFCRDTINPIHFENVLSLHQINPAKVSADTKIADCFSYYRNLLLSHTDKDLSVDHPVLQMHKRADNFEDIFDINSVNAMTRYEIDDILSSWIEHDNPEEWYEERELLISHITSEYVLTAFERLFGEGNDDTCTDMIYDTLENTTVHIVTDTENGVVESTNILTYLLGKHGLNGFIDIDTGLPAGILDEYAMNELVERQLVLAPFVYECLELIKKQKAGKVGAPSEFESFVNEFAEQNNGYWEPFELVKAYASNLD